MRYPLAIMMLLLAGCAGPNTQRQAAPSAPGEGAGGAWPDVAETVLPPGVARVTIDRYAFDERDRSVVEAAVEARDVGVSVSAGQLGGRNGLVVFGANPSVRAAIRGAQSRTARSSTSSQFLLLDEGASGSLAMLESQPQAWAVVIPIYRGAAVIETFAETITGTGMTVRVDRVGAEAATVSLAPLFHRRMGRRALEIETLTTALTLRPGVPYVIMSDQSREQSVASALLSRRTMSEHRQVIVVLTVELGPPR